MTSAASSPTTSASRWPRTVSRGRARRVAADSVAWTTTLSWTTRRRPRGWIDPGMWIGSRAQLSRSTGSSGARVGSKRSPAWRTPQCARWSGDGGQQLAARVLARMTCLGAQAAVLVVLRVARALRATGRARLDTGLEHRAGDLGLVGGLAGEDPGGRRADVGAVGAGPEAPPRAADQVPAQAAVRAAGAGLGQGGQVGRA